MRGEVARTTVKLTPSPRETFEVGIDLGSPISLYHFDRESYAVEGELSAVSVQLKLG